MRMQRIMAGLMALLILLTLFSGCSLIGQNDEEEIIVKQLYIYYPHDISYIMKSLIMEFNDMQDEVEVEGIEGSASRKEFSEKLDELVQEGETVPDVILIHDTWLARLAAEEKIRPIDGGLSQDKTERFFGGMVNAMVWEEETYGLPFWQDMPLLYYRSDLMEAPPSSWEELAYMAVQIKKANDMEYGLVFPGASEVNAAAFLANIWFSFGSYPDFEAEDTVFDEQSVANTWNYLVSLARNEALSPNSMTMNAENSRSVFESGNAVFMWNWSYAARMFLDEESPVFGNVGVAPMPVSHDIAEAGGVLSGYALTMSKGTSLIPESWEFMQFLVSEQSQKRMRDAGLMPADSSLYHTEWLKKIGLPSSYKNMLNSGHTLKPGKNVDGTLNVLAEGVSLAFEQNKKLEDFILLLKEGIVEDEPVDETELDEEGSEGEEEETDQTEQNDSSDDESVSAEESSE